MTEDEPELSDHTPNTPEPSPEEFAALARRDDGAPVHQEQPVQTARRISGRGDGSEADLQRKVTYLPDVHRLLPQSPDAEKGVLSSFLLSPREVGGMCVEKRITPEHFFLPSHREIYTVLLELWDANKQIDFITLTQIMRDRNRLDSCGGAAFVTELFTFLPTAANAAYYVDILIEKNTLRRIICVGTEYAARGYDEQDDVPGLLNNFEQNVLTINAGLGSLDSIAPAKEGVVEAIAAIEEMYERKGQIGGLATGFADLDKMIDGLHPGEMVVIAARPSQGKTALAMNIVEHVAVELKKPVAVFSLEMSRQQLWQRLLCARARVNLGRVRDGFLSERDFPALQVAASKLTEAKIWIDDAAELTIQELRAKARRMRMQNKIELIVVDYLQLLRGTSKRSQGNREQEVAEVSAGLKAMSKELGIPVLVLAQMSRKFEERGVNARPRLSDLRESGSIEQDADTVAFLVRPETNTDLSEDEKRSVEGMAELIIAKQRHGPTGDVKLTFLKEFTRFETRARECDVDAEDTQGSLC